MLYSFYLFVGCQCGKYLNHYYFQDWSPEDFYNYVKANYSFNIGVVITISLCIVMTILFVGFKLCHRVEALRQYWLKDKRDEDRPREGSFAFAAAFQTDNDSIL